jgi:hypothetical protein
MGQAFTQIQQQIANQGLVPQPTPMVMDLSGMFYLQKDYLDNIVTNNNGDAAMISTLKGQMNDLYNNFKTSNVSTNQVLDHQTQMNEIVDTENARLLLKKQNIDNALVGKKRSIELNENYRLRYAAYTNMIIIIVIALVIYILLNVASRFLPFVPSITFDILNAIVIAGAIILLFLNYVDYTNRDTLYYNQLKIAPPKNGQLDPNAQGAGAYLSGTGSTILTGTAGCVGEACCDASNGVIWNKDSMQCELPTYVYPTPNPSATTAPLFSALDITTQGFATMTPTKPIIKVVNDGAVADYSNEYENYSKYA